MFVHPDGFESPESTSETENVVVFDVSATHFDELLLYMH
jgi:hypothetical protein